MTVNKKITIFRHIMSCNLVDTSRRFEKETEYIAVGSSKRWKTSHQMQGVTNHVTKFQQSHYLTFLFRQNPVSILESNLHFSAPAVVPAAAVVDIVVVLIVKLVVVVVVIAIAAVSAVAAAVVNVNINTAVVVD
jgi:hypothetical protein